MQAVILFGTGSRLISDVEESLFRAGVQIAAGVRNHSAPSFLDDGIPCHAPADLYPRDLPFLIPLFTPAHRQTAAREAAAVGLVKPFRLIDPTVPVPRRLDIAEGCYINAGCVLGSGCVFDRFVLINRGASIGHHARLAPFVSIGPGAILAGEVTIETGVMVGAGAVILPGVRIGANTVIGAGSVVTGDVPAGCLVHGESARIVRRDIGGYHGMSVT